MFSVIKSIGFTFTVYIQGVPFLLEDKIVELGGKYAKAENLWKVGGKFH